MKKILVLLLCLVLSGCVTAIDNLRADNRQNLLRLSVGMPKQEALNLMRVTTMRAYSSNVGWVTLTNPHRSEILQGKDKTFEVVYYFTDVKSVDGAITDDELTPLIFDEGKLIGWGWSFLDDNVKKYELRLR